MVSGTRALDLSRVNFTMTKKKDFPAFQPSLHARCCIFADDSLGDVHEFHGSFAIHGDSTDEPEGNEEAFPRLPAVVAATPASAETTRATSARYSQGKLRSCEKKTDLYILQPDRLNTSGQSNPLKGKLTNCHDTGCERCVKLSSDKTRARKTQLAQRVPTRRRFVAAFQKKKIHHLFSFQAFQRAKDSPYELDSTGSGYVVSMRKQTIEHRSDRSSDRAWCLYREERTFVSS